MAFEGVVENGQIRLADDLALPEKVKVYIIVPSGDPEQPIRIRSPRLANPQDAADFAKKVFEGLTWPAIRVDRSRPGGPDESRTGP
jgi:hypothetical protein